MPYFGVLQDGLAKGPSDADLVFCSWVLDVRMNTLEKTDKDLIRKWFYINLITLNFVNIGNMWALMEMKLIIHIAVSCSKLMQCLEFRFWPYGKYLITLSAVESWNKI